MAEIIPIHKELSGADGRPLVPVTEDLTSFASAPNQTLEGLLLTAGRMLRDGYTLKQIKVELHGDASLGVTDTVMENFARRGLALLERRIAEGREPAESRHTTMTDQLDIDADKQAMDDALAFDPTGQNNVSPEYLRDD